MSSRPIANTHIHTPYSFSAFESIEEAVACARREQIAVLGISDFNTVEGFERFGELCRRNRIHPLYNIEFIALSREDKREGKRFNDPKNPGVMYFCGKALRVPVCFGRESRATLEALREGGRTRIATMIATLNDYLATRGLELSFDYDDIKARYAENTVRERHIAKALFHAFDRRFEDYRRLEAYRRLFDDAAFTADLGDRVHMQNLIRARLLKAGTPVFVEEREEAFLTPQRLRELILDGEGVPCYPVLADDSAELNERERDPEALAAYLREQEIHAVEFIPQRNGLKHLSRYVRLFRERGFCITFGTEHNTPARGSLIPAARGQTPLTDELGHIGYEGACILAAHQQLVIEGKKGYVDRRGRRCVGVEQMSELARFGNEVIRASLAG
jgi:hypothetical protein